MNAQILTFSANEQTLIKTGGIDDFASNTVRYAKATFTLGTNWTGFDSVRAVWKTACYTISTVLDANHSCDVPPEVLSYKAKVYVNLVGSISENGVLTDRLTTFPVLAMHIKSNAPVEGTETAPVTASQFEQFVETVQDAAGSISDYSYDSEAWAVGKRGGVDVPSTDETYHNNSKYWAEQNAGLSDEVADLKEDYKERFNFVNNKIGTEKQFNDLIYRQGHIRDNGTIGDSSYHCRTDFKQFGLNNVEMVIPNGYEIKVAEYIEDDSSTFTGFVIDQYKTGTINFIAKDTRYYCIAIKRTDDSTLNPSTVPDSAKIYNTYLFTDTSLTVPNKPADAKQTGNKISEINNTLAGMIVKSPNLFDPSTDKKSWWVNSTTGIPFLDTDANYGISDYISIKKNTTYGVRACIKVWFYDVNHTYISLSEVPSAGKVFGPYTEDRYVILGYREALLDSVTLMESSEIPNITPYENPYINNDYIKIPSIVSSDYDLDHNTGLYFGTVPTGYYNGHNSDYTADGFSANTSYTDIISKFDALVDGGYVTKQDLGVSSDGTNHIYEYDFIPTACPLDGSVGKSKDVPTVLIVSGQHGFEKASIYGLYYFLKDLCTITNDPIITYLRNHVKIKTIPAANPYGINNGSYCNANGVNLNRNYDTPGFVGGGTPFTTTYGGETAGSEAETQAICNFITNNPNAVIMADFHTQGRAAVSSFDRICWLDFAPIKDDYFNLYRYMGCAHVENLTAHFINDYSLSVPYGTLCGRCSSGESGYTATFPSVDVWSLEHGIVGHTIEGFTGFPNSSDYSGDALKANSEIIGNWIIAVMYGTAHIN